MVNIMWMLYVSCIMGILVRSFEGGGWKVDSEVHCEVMGMGGFEEYQVKPITHFSLSKLVWRFV